MMRLKIRPKFFALHRVIIGLSENGMVASSGDEVVIFPLVCGG
jgi:molybdopterin converting factor small subunit